MLLVCITVHYYLWLFAEFEKCQTKLKRKRLGKSVSTENDITYSTSTIIHHRKIINLIIPKFVFYETVSLEKHHV